MTVTEKYIDFILDNFIGNNIKVQLPKPYKEGVMWVKLGFIIYQEVQIEVLEKYTRSVKLKLSFDKYEIEQLVFIPVESAPTSITGKFRNKVENLVYKVFFDDGRQEEISKMYEEKQNKFFLNFIAERENKKEYFTLISSK